jgi:hypothetical protein
LIPPFEAGFLETSAPLSGSVFPQPVAITQSRSPVLMDDLLPPCFHIVLLADQVNQPDLDEICTVASQLGIFVVAVQEKILPKDSSPDQLLHMQETIPLIKTYLMNGSCIGAIVRPDHYVYCGVTDTQNALDAMATLAAKLQFQN